jgi:tetratricopeptide (TPR) repeat protein
MLSVEVVDAIPIPDVDTARLEAAAHALERAIAAGCQDPNVIYMLAMAHKRQGKTNEARTALRKISRPDANILLQMGLISLLEQNLAQAEGELARAWEMDKNSYEICYNLLLTQLTLGKVELCLTLLPRAIELAAANPPAIARADSTAADEVRFLRILQSLLKNCIKKGSEIRADSILEQLTPQDEQRLLRVVRSLGQLDTVHTLLKGLADARPRSGPVREAYVEAVLVKSKELMDRCTWTEAELLLRPLAHDKSAGRHAQAALLNLMGCCAAMTQDFDSALNYFNSAIKLSGNDARLHQNVALTHELQGDLAEAEPYWNRYLDLIDGKVPAPSDMPEYRDNLAYESLSRLATRYTEKEKWHNALGYVQRAYRIRPNDPDTLERLFHLYNHNKMQKEARKTLEKLRHLRPNDPQMELYELDLIEVKNLSDIERLLTDIDAILKKHPGDARVEERAVGMVGNVIPLMGSLCDQLTDQMTKVIDQVKHLPNYQINWAAVREVMRDLLKEFQKLRRITGKCLPLVTSDEHKRIIRDLGEHIDKKMEACRSFGA